MNFIYKMDAFTIGYTVGPWILKIVVFIAGVYILYNMSRKNKEMHGN